LKRKSRGNNEGKEAQAQLLELGIEFPGGKE